VSKPTNTGEGEEYLGESQLYLQLVVGHSEVHRHRVLGPLHNLQLPLQLLLLRPLLLQLTVCREKERERKTPTPPKDKNLTKNDNEEN
jgi:hypothetical protein